jgi:hypothetical protein
MDGDNNRVAAIICSIVFFIGFLIGAAVIGSKFKADKYDCTVKCPNNSHSIYVDEKCFCEVK